MKLLKKAVAAALAMLMLTACGGGGGGSAGGGGTPIAPSTFSSTKTYKLAQSGEGKPLYMEYWEAYTDDETGALIQNKDTVVKEGTLNGNMYADVYQKDILTITMISSNEISYAVIYDVDDGTPGDSVYDQYVEVAKVGGATVPDGEPVCINMTMSSQALDGKRSGINNDNTGMADPGNLNESKITVQTGTYTMPGTSVKYYAEIFTNKADPTKTLTYAYDANDELKAVVGVDGNNTQALFFNKYEYDSSMFNAKKLNVASYNATDITVAYIAGLKKIQQGQD